MSIKPFTLLFNIQNNFLLSYLQTTRVKQKRNKLKKEIICNLLKRKRENILTNKVTKD